MDRAIGYRPWEVSVMVNELVVARHAGDAAFLWTMRDAAIGQPHNRLDDLVRLDDRVEAHLDALREGGEFAWRCCCRNLDSIGAGEVFPLTVLAFGSGKPQRMRDALLAGTASRSVQRGLVSALAWLGSGVTAPWLRLLLRATGSAQRLVGIAALALQREDAGSALASALHDKDPALRARALRAVGECRRRDLLDELRSHLDDQEDNRFWAAWSLTLLGDEAGLSVLLECINEGTSHAIRAAQIGLRASGLSLGRGIVNSLALRPGFERFAVFATGILGDPQSIPWLLGKMEHSPTARLAGEAFSAITGADLVFEDLNSDAGPLADDELPSDEAIPFPPDYEANLPLPDVAKAHRWWVEHRSSFKGGDRYLAGALISVEAVMQALVRRTQRLRAAAAYELAILRPRAVLFNVCERGRDQKRRLAEWNS